MKPLKALGPDGFQLGFYQKFWNTVALSLTEFVNRCFSNCFIHGEANHTFLTLIPKVESPTLISQFRPSSLCNVSFKIIIEIITYMGPLYLIFRDGPSISYLFYGDGLILFAKVDKSQCFVGVSINFIIRSLVLF